MFKRFLLLLLLAWGFAVAGSAAAAPAILVWGDSLSAAYGLEPSQGWVQLLDRRLRAQGYDYTVVNGSVSGETTAGGLTRLPAALAEHKPAIVIIELGANDGLRGTPVRVMQDNLSRMIALSRKAGSKVLLLGILMPPNYGAEYTRAFSQAYKDLARRYGVPLLPFLLKGVAEHRELMQADGMHPIAEAEPQVLDNVWPGLKPLLKKPRP
ncbi:MAG TPA: arylesterase [Gammaproteobacteria bacterium]|nr:arylesterase [Gammaproteobacteria bacterium]